MEIVLVAERAAMATHPLSDLLVRLHSGIEKDVPLELLHQDKIEIPHLFNLLGLAHPIEELQASSYPFIVGAVLPF
jgi:hypothetical protein